MQTFFDNQYFFYFNPDQIILILNVYNFPQTIDKQIKNLQSYMQKIRNYLFIDLMELSLVIRYF